VPFPSNSPSLSDFGNCIVVCNQNSKCRQRFCYHCRSLCKDQQARYCGLCSGHDASKHPKALNHYFYKANRGSKDTCLLYRNEELNLDICVSQLKEMVDIKNSPWMEHGRGTDTMHAMRCFSCLGGFVKSQDCNGMKHCGVERCYVCGYSMAQRGQSLPLRHWDDCPRFDSSSYWNQQAKCKWLCRSGHCYGHKIGECKKPKHQAGIRRMHEERRRLQFTQAFDSLIPSLQEEVKLHIKANPKDCARLQIYFNKMNKSLGQ